MIFENILVPYNWVEIVNITRKDRSPLSPDNWRRKILVLLQFAGSPEALPIQLRFSEHGPDW